MHVEIQHIPTWEAIRKDWDILATQFPLLAAIFAPSSVLFDIPALTQHWISLNGVAVKTPHWTNVLSATGLALNIVANALLVARFSDVNRRVGVLATRLSAMFWILKATMELVNVSLFAHQNKDIPVADYQEGFWCAILSLMISGTVAIMLAYHWVTRGADSVEEKMEERNFMLSILTFVALIALEALVFSEIEHWAYFDGIYFSVVSAFTIGFGDFSPTKTSSRILLFPFLLCSIALLANQISMIIDYFSAKSEARKDSWRRNYEIQRQREEDKAHPQADLEKEMHFLRTTRVREDLISNIYDLIYSLAGMLVFWFIGAVMFHFMEGWDYGLSLYFSYVVFLTIGYGDLTPHTPAGRVVFVVYAFLAVPIVTSFAVQTVTNLLASITQARIDSNREKLGLDHEMPKGWEEPAPDPPDPRNPVFVSHAEWVARYHEHMDDTVIRRYAQSSDTEPVDGPEQDEKLFESLTDEEQKKVDGALLDMIIETALDLEAQARSIMIEHLPAASRASLLLKADRNVQHRDLRLLEESGVEAKGDPKHEGYPSRVGDEFGEYDILQQVHLYRKTFARLLAASSKLKRLQGVERHLFERRKMEHKSKEESGVGFT